jgi:glutamine amidotransferase
MAQPTVVDYGGSNLRSVVKALEYLDLSPRVVDSASALATAGPIILPGVGAAGQIMRSLRGRGLDEAVQAHIEAGRPFLGVCMGMQVLMSASEEDGGQACLDVFAGRVRKLPPTGKVPHMGWNTVSQRQQHPIWSGIPDESYFYFVHSYAVQPEDPSVVAGATEYEVTFASAVARANVVGTQFHPEKSGRRGLQIYRNFMDWACST